MINHHFSLWPALVAVALISPATLHAQNPVWLVCRDGTTAPGPDPAACAQHGGVDQAATNAAVRARAGAAQDTTQTVVCIDGSNAPAGASACKTHGGVDSVATRAALRARGRGQAAGAAPTNRESTGVDTAGRRPPRARDTRDTMFRRDSM